MGKKKRVKERKGKRKPGKKVKIQRHNLYKVEGDKAVRQRKPCTKCGAGIFMAEHKDRFTCGNCGYTEWKKSK